MQKYLFVPYLLMMKLTLDRENGVVDSCSGVPTVLSKIERSTYMYINVYIVHVGCFTIMVHKYVSQSVQI